MLLDLIDAWGSHIEGGVRDGLPSGIAELRDALSSDVHDRPGRD